MRFAKIDFKLKNVKQRLNPSVSELITHIKMLKTQLSEFSKSYQEYSNFFHALYSHLRNAMLKNRFEILSRK